MQRKNTSESKDYVICPYDKNHLIRKERLQRHLPLCRRNHPEARKKTCPFDITHIVDEAELDAHVKECPNRTSFEMAKLAALTITPKPGPSMPEIACEENWDDDPDVPTYCPQKYIENRPIIRMLKGASPSQKAQFRKDERQRFNKVLNPIK